jgi:peptidoglycan/LPS O-acetylase OafA/YrhL
MLAIFLVLWSHPPVQPSGVTGLLSDRLGPTGVDLFFVLSGFLIGSLLFDEVAKTDKLDVKRFWIRRFLKIIPPYLLLVFVGTALNIFRYRHSPLDGLTAMWPNFVHIQNYVRGDRPLGQTWSLAVEEHFYLALPCLLAFMVKAKLVWSRFPLIAVGILICSLLFRVLLVNVPYSPQSHIFATHIRIDNLMLGVLVALLAKTEHPVLDSLLKHWKFAMLLAGILIGLPCFFDRSNPFVFTIGYSLFAFGYAIFVVLAYKATFHFDLSNLPLVHKAAILIGQCSYSIYLWMAILAGRPLEIIAGRIKFESEFKYWLLLLVYLVWASIIGIVMHRLIEIPINAYRNRLFPRAAA